MNFLVLATRNIIRNWHRSLVTTVAMGFACAMMIVFAALIEGFIKGSEYNIVTVNTGDIQIHQPGYRDDPDIYALIDNADELVRQIRDHGLAASERIYTAGLLASDASSAGAQLRGVDLDNEPSVSDIYRHIAEGQWLDKQAPHGVVIGKKLARLLDVTVGDELIFVGQTYDGYMANDRFVVRGILKTVSSVVDTAGVMLSTQMLRELISLPHGAHEIVVMRQQRSDDLLQVQHIVKQLAGDKLEVLNWRELMPIINRFLQTADIQTFIMLIFTYIAVGSVVLNAMLMSVFERIQQFGIMKAIGVRPWQLLRLIYAESLLQAVLASIVGTGFGVAIAWYLQQHGIDMSALTEGFAFAGMALDPVWYAALSVRTVIEPVLFLLVMTVVAVIYPAWMAARLRPVEAIHFH